MMGIDGLEITWQVEGCRLARVGDDAMRDGSVYNVRTDM